MKKEKIEKAKIGDVIETNTGKKFNVVDASFLDLYNKIKRGAQIIPLKDIAAIIAETGLQKDWKIVDTGSGSGGLCLFLANFVKKVYTYDIREDHLNIVKKNIKFLGLKNIVAEKHDVYKSIPQKNIDLITLDLPEPWLALENAVKALKPGGFLVSYSPSIPQTSDFVEKVVKNKNLLHIKTIEILQREWDVEKRKIRPKTQGIGHSGFLTFCRRL